LIHPAGEKIQIHLSEVFILFGVLKRLDYGGSDLSWRRLNELWRCPPSMESLGQPPFGIRHCVMDAAD
jgi:hypothetical protein